MNIFGEPTRRMKQMRQDLLAIQPAVCVERALLVTEAYKSHISDQVVLQRAHALAATLRNMSVFIEPDTLLVGNQASLNRSAPIFPEYAMDWVIQELDEFAQRDGDRFIISDASKNLLREIYPFWKGRTLQDRGYAAFPAQARLLYDLGIIKTEGNITSGDAHIAVNYGMVLREGLISYRERTRTALACLNLAHFDDLKKSYFYEAILIVIAAVEDFSMRFSLLAGKEASSASPERAQELQEISRICRFVPMQPARTFQEALQSLWFIHLILQIESNGHSLSFGRLDQYCLPYYEKSRREGMTENQACELLENLWLKTFTINKIRSWPHTRFSAGSPLYQNVTVGGQTPDGQDAVNELSYLVIKSVARCHLPQPNLTVRYHSGLDDKFLRQCVEVIKQGFGMPAFNNDEIIIPSFIQLGVSKEDAYNYSAIGCVEVAVPGKWGYRCTGMSFLNFPKTLLIALNNGTDPESGKQVLPGVGHFKDMDTFDDVMHAWDVFCREFARQAVVLDSCADLVLEQLVPDILCSALTDDCITRGRHLKEGGAVYDFISQLQVGIANLGDSLAAIKKCVYEDRSVTREELWDALMNDFSGSVGERVRRRLLAAPKYGNDDDDVDQLLVKGYDSYIEEIAKYRNTRHGRGPIGGTYFAGTSSISANVPQGACVGATPDGRHAGEPLAEGCSPAHGMDVNGPTSVFKSVAKLRTGKITGGVLLNQKLNPSSLSEERDCRKLMMLVRTFFDVLKGFHVQFNVVARETLLDAQVHPEKHRDLIVRVAGYSAFFNVLSRQSQDDIIARTEQVLK
jgi:pyruvate formate-lyase/glycerol dehydratase family glycyl radical enzyme